ncbi:MAG TPA: DUF6188 family protein [Ktedonobacterales bacterium]|nr:DUF6188 family protein [Ktedonobacterales bacterium]
MTTAETGGSVEVHLGGFTVMRCVVDYAFSLDLARPEAAVRVQQWASVRIGGPFDYVVEDTTRRLDAAECPEELGPALRLFRQTVESATITHGGTLQIQFSGRAFLRIPSLADYEAWEVTEGDGRRLICMPGGEIAIFEAPPERHGSPQADGS